MGDALLHTAGPDVRYLGSLCCVEGLGQSWCQGQGSYSVGRLTRTVDVLGRYGHFVHRKRH